MVTGTIESDPTFPDCFVCGSSNPSGLHVAFEREGEAGSRALYTPHPDHVGWPGVVHGGLLFTLMDEAVAWAVTYSGVRAVTGKAEVRFRTPGRVGVPLAVTARIIKASRGLVRGRAEIRVAADPDIVVAEMEATMVRVGVGETVQANDGVGQAEEQDVRS
jgi:acyl-coenzyme A thioesterase PaaI-like protein